jgi:hypothetical protein
MMIYMTRRDKIFLGVLSAVSLLSLGGCGESPTELCSKPEAVAIYRKIGLNSIPTDWPLLIGGRAMENGTYKCVVTVATNTYTFKLEMMDNGTFLVTNMPTNNQ